MVDSSAIYAALGTICRYSCSKSGKPWRATFPPAVGPRGQREAACYGSSFHEASTPSECISLLLRISVAPGPIFSAQRSYSNFIRVNFAHPWSETMDNAVKTLGTLTTELMRPGNV